MFLDILWSLCVVRNALKRVIHAILRKYGILWCRSCQKETRNENYNKIFEILKQKLPMKVGTIP